MTFLNDHDVKGERKPANHRLAACSMAGVSDELVRGRKMMHKQKIPGTAYGLRYFGKQRF
jgi:hypothetical protein